MFGVIPRVMWEKLIKPDEYNNIPMVNNLFVLKAHGKNMIFDIGLGDSLSGREKKIYNCNGNTLLSEGLKESGLAFKDIDYVVLTHLHTDHAGGGVMLDADGEFVPRFPNAKYIASKEEFEVATKPNERTSAVYIPARYHALKNAGQLELIDANTELFPGIKAVFTGGHTEGHFGLEMESEGEHVWYYADIFPTSAHVRVPFVPATDLYPLQSLEIKRAKLPEIIEKKVVLAFDHDTTAPFARVTQPDKKLIVETFTG